eukprot:CAMPEP_0178720334 /NCGR_PEP_ID=MMETSP0699-20121125/23665_1 /TAXON_ID=265572 /ORGANISM="Extubocellulus spinifer, Strain CCMP396" /LENGTH=434 /DNA_ID=CAMNT_0020370755 /DNA_START=6 /DNA_END=1311 /DNA_ORIENTATION=+
MSRAALWRQEANVKERQRQAEETFRLAIDEGRSAPARGQLRLHGPDDSFNLNPMLLHNISVSPYFQKCYNKLKDWNALVDEIYYEVKHMEPWTPGAVKTPSTAFCLLVRLFTLRCTEKQMSLMLDHIDSPYIRCVGFLYLRYAVDPNIVWSWMEPYLYDEEPVQIAANPAKPEITVGEYVRQLLTEMDYYGTLLPRLPVQIERDIKVSLLQAEQIEDRAKSNLRDPSKMDHFRRVGSSARALYGDEENPVTWYDCVVDRVLTHDDATGEPLARPKFVVTFPEYGNTETVSVGEIDLRLPPAVQVEEEAEDEVDMMVIMMAGVGREADIIAAVAESATTAEVKGAGGIMTIEIGDGDAPLVATATTGNMVGAVKMIVGGVTALTEMRCLGTTNAADPEAAIVMEGGRGTCWKKFAVVTVRLLRRKAEITLGALLL